MIELEALQDLVACLQESGYRRIGADGVDGCGKTTLAKSLAEQLEIPLISLDDYLDKNRGGYLGHLRYEELKRAFHAESQCIVEGVCLLQALEIANLGIDALVYVKRMQHGIWADERECDVNIENVEVFLQAEKQLVEMFYFGETDQTNSSLPKLSEEIIRYHASYRPFEQAVFLYCSDI
ncbi:MAG: shikimate kinase [Pseudomonadota bacterium]